jgi:hypothetical protein
MQNGQRRENILKMVVTVATVGRGFFGLLALATVVNIMEQILNRNTCDMFRVGFLAATVVLWWGFGKLRDAGERWRATSSSTVPEPPSSQSQTGPKP